MEDRRIDHNLVEFEKLKDEQINRIRFRDGLFYFTMATIGGALTLACSEHNHYTPEVLLAVPFALFIAGVAQISCERRVDDIGIYIRDVLSIAVAEDERLGCSGVFEWEQYLRVAPLSLIRKLLRIVANTLLYVGSGYFLLLFYSVLKPLPAAAQKAVPGVLSWEGLAFWTDAYLLALLLALIILFSAVKWKRPSKGKHSRIWVLWKLLKGLLTVVIATATFVAFIQMVPAAWLFELAANLRRLVVMAAHPLYLCATFTALFAGTLFFLMSRPFLRH